MTKFFMLRFFTRPFFSLENFIRWFIFGMVFLVPIFFLPFTRESLTVAKSILLLLGVVAVVFVMLWRVGRGEVVSWYRSILDWPLLFLVVLTGASVVFSLSPFVSMFGSMSEFVHTGLSMFIFVVFAWLLLQQLAGGRSPRRFLVALVLSGLVVAGVFALNTIPLFSVVPFLREILGDFSFNLVGGEGSGLGMFLVVLQLLSVALILPKNVPLRVGVLAGVALVGSLWGLMSIGFSFLWWLSVVGLLLLVVLGYFFFLEMRKGSLYLCFFLFLLSLGCVFFGSPAFFTHPLPTEVALGLSPSWQVTEQALLSEPKNLFLGTGPGTFLYDFSLYRPVVFNTDPLVWSFRFTRPFNTFLALLIEFGSVFVITLVLLVLLVCASVALAFRKVWQHGRQILRLPSLSSKDEGVVEALLVFPAWVVLTLGVWFVFFSLVLWFVWWFLTIFLLSGCARVIPSFLREHKIHLRLSNQQFLLFAFGGILVGVVVLFFVAFLVRGYMAEVIFTKATRESNPFVAEPLLQKATRYYPHYAPYQNTLARVYLEQARIVSGEADQGEVVVQRLALATNVAKVATEIEPNNVEYFDTLLTLYLNAQVFVPEAKTFAKEAATRAIELEPTNAILYAKLGNVFREEGEKVEAEKSFLTALKLKIDYAPVYFDLARLYEETEQIDKALAVYQNALGQFPDNAEFLYQLGRVLYNRNQGSDRADAESVWLRVVEIDPTYSNALYSLGLLYENRGEVARAVGYFQKVRELNPQNDDVRKKLQSLLRG